MIPEFVWRYHRQTNSLTLQPPHFQFQGHCKAQQYKLAIRFQVYKVDEHRFHSDLNKDKSTMIGMKSYRPSNADVFL